MYPRGTPLRITENRHQAGYICGVAQMQQKRNRRGVLVGTPQRNLKLIIIGNLNVPAVKAALQITDFRNVAVKLRGKADRDLSAAGNGNVDLCVPGTISLGRKIAVQAERFRLLDPPGFNVTGGLVRAAVLRESDRQHRVGPDRRRYGRRLVKMPVHDQPLPVYQACRILRMCSNLLSGQGATPEAHLVIEA